MTWNIDFHTDFYSVELMAEEMTLQDLRKARKFTQIRMGKLLKLFAAKFWISLEYLGK